MFAGIHWVIMSVLLSHHGTIKLCQSPSEISKETLISAHELLQLFVDTFPSDTVNFQPPLHPETTAAVL